MKPMGRYWVEEPKKPFRLSVYRDRTGQYRWRLTRVNGGKIIADSGEGYTRERDAWRAVKRLPLAIHLIGIDL